jgi:hypothetical protein
LENREKREDNKNDAERGRLRWTAKVRCYQLMCVTAMGALSFIATEKQKIHPEVRSEPNDLQL